VDREVVDLAAIVALVRGGVSVVSVAADVLRMVHPEEVAAGLGWAVAKSDNKPFAYDV
jgi:hypothetical protein